MSLKTKDPIQIAIQKALPASCSIYVHTRRKSWSGSGFHIGNGILITASHVCPPEIQHSGEINVTFDEKILYQCNVIASEPNIDIAILKIIGDYSKISSVTLANSDYVEVGDVCAVLGAPEGWHDTATVGRVSNINQSMGSQAPSNAWNNVTFVDAKILQGVSGGMCIDINGLVIGAVIGVTGIMSPYGMGENVIVPAYKIINLIKTVY